MSLAHRFLVESEKSEVTSDVRRLKMKPKLNTFNY